MKSSKATFLMVVSVLYRCFQDLSLLCKKEKRGYTDLKVVWELYPKHNDREVRMLRGSSKPHERK